MDSESFLSYELYDKPPAISYKDRLNLTMKIYESHLGIMGGTTDGDMKESYDHAVKAANYFFDQLEKGNE